MGEAPTRICLFFLILCFPVLFFLLYMFQKNKELDRWVGGAWPIRVFLGFLDP